MSPEKRFSGNVSGDQQTLAARSYSSAPGPPHSEAPPCELRHQDVPMLALDLDDAIAHRSAGAALLLEVAREFLELRLCERESRDDRYSLALPSFCLPSDAHDAVTGRASRSFLPAPTFGYGTATFGARAPDVGGVDEAAVASLLAWHTIT